MSVSTTEVVPATVSDLLKAYDLHHSGVESSQSQRTAPRQPENPPSWPSNRRRMPAYREPSRDHRLADRPAGQDTVEGVMVTVMFIGVYVNSVSFTLQAVWACYVKNSVVTGWGGMQANRGVE